MKEIRIVTPSKEVLNFLINLVEKKGFKLIDREDDEIKYIHILGDGKYRLYSAFYFNPSSHYSFVSIEDAINIIYNKVIKIGDYPVLINKNKSIIQIGCQKISKDIVKKIYDTLFF